jgi:hypothetical protein
MSPNQVAFPPAPTEAPTFSMGYHTIYQEEFLDRFDIKLKYGTFAYYGGREYTLGTGSTVGLVLIGCWARGWNLDMMKRIDLYIVFSVIGVP